MNRLPFNHISIGTNGGGKTTLMKKYLRCNQRNLIIPANRGDKAWHGIQELKGEWRRTSDERTGKAAYYYHIPELQTFTGTRVIFIEGEYGDEIFKAICHEQRGFTHGALFMDDFKRYIPTVGRLPKYVTSMFGDRRFRMLDIWLAAWTFQDVNDDLLGFDPQLFLYRTTRPPNASIKNGWPHYDEMLKVVARVNAANAKLPEDKKHYYEPFPAIQQ